MTRLLRDIGESVMGFASDAISMNLFKYSLKEGKVYSVDELIRRGCRFDLSENNSRLLIRQGNCRLYSGVYAIEDNRIEKSIKILNGPYTPWMKEGMDYLNNFRPY